MTQFTLCRIVPAGYPHAAALDEVADTLRHAIEALGHTVDVRHNTLGSQGVNLVLAAHLLDEAGAHTFPPETVVYNLEQIDENSTWLRPGLLTALGRCVVWDYSEGTPERILRETTGPLGRMARTSLIEETSALEATIDRVPRTNAL